MRERTLLRRAAVLARPPPLAACCACHDVRKPSLELRAALTLMPILIAGCCMFRYKLTTKVQATAGAAAAAALPKPGAVLHRNKCAPAALAGSEHLHQLIGGHIQQLVQVHALHRRDNRRKGARRELGSGGGPAAGRRACCTADAGRRPARRVCQRHEAVPCACEASPSSLPLLGHAAAPSCVCALSAPAACPMALQSASGTHAVRILAERALLGLTLHVCCCCPPRAQAASWPRAERGRGRRAGGAWPPRPPCCGDPEHGSPPRVAEPLAAEAALLIDLRAHQHAA